MEPLSQLIFITRGWEMNFLCVCKWNTSHVSDKEMDSITVQIHKQQIFYHALEVLMKPSIVHGLCPKLVRVDISFCIWSHK